MNTFNPREEKYIYCCFFDAHVTTLASVFMGIYDLSYFVALFNATTKLDFVPFLGIPIICLGVYGLFNESRVLLLAYMVVNVIASILLMVYVLGRVATDPKLNIPEQQGVALPGALLSCSIVLLLQIPYTSVLWNLTNFIKDREMSEQDTVDNLCYRSGIQLSRY